MNTWFDLSPVEKTLFYTAAYRFVYPMHLRADADEVWAKLVAPTPLPWVRLLNGEYAGPPPHGIGTKRSIRVGPGLLRLREHFFEWDNDKRRHSFYAEQANVPLFRAFAEDYQVQPMPTGCLFTWTFAFDPKPGFGLAVAAGRPVNRLLFDSFVRDTRKHFGDYRQLPPTRRDSRRRHRGRRSQTPWARR